MSGGKAPFHLANASLKGHKALQTKEFAAVRKGGTSFKGKYLVINVLPALDQETRLGIIVSKRFHLRAVRRNRARRLIREGFRLLRPGIKNGLEDRVWLVVIARRYLENANLHDVQSEYIKLLTEADYWQGS